MAALLALLCVGSAEAKRSHGSLKKTSGTPWVYIDKFCFRQSGATMAIDMTQFNANGSVLINLYADMWYAWPRIYKNRGRWSCKDLASNATASLDIRSVPLTIRIYGRRDRWWFITASNCAGSQISIWYNLTMLNPAALSDEFSADEIGVLETTIVFFCLNVLLLAWVSYSWFRLKWSGKQYAITKRLMISTVLHVCSLFCTIVHYGKYATDGEGVPALDVVAQFADICSEMVFLLLIIFLAKGYKISGRHLAHKRLMILCFLPFPLAYFALFLYSILGIDPATNLYVYESPPGYLIIAFHIVAFAWFAAVVVRSFRVEKSPSRRAFYAIFGVGYGAWFLSVPIIVLIMHFVGPWMRKKAVFAVDEIIMFFALVGLSALFAPPPVQSPLVEKMKYDTGFDNPMQVFPK
eukprot:m51a1_g300 hypothetical protein (408) ;mRNA; r:371314-373100